MNQKSQILIDLIFNKLKKYKTNEIFLEKDTLNRFIYSLLKEN